MGDHPDFLPVNIIHTVISERHYMRNGDNILLKQDTCISVIIMRV